ncbi:iron uptake system protein EfeO [Terrabacter sp. MAHUQ-38]|jgi:iron uptake system component EfeO|uniref:iron uptake system protein EfeO n=1 Tax=unclassified Terrabacter TaxID=2630222 RepID=UPI00165DCCF8|nr:iron uptake system protein EfeO [Terrabacter sp. MAHUQ-38]MBC9819950.1 cupredoxin domain-containing protein [Terrabacter sp. MAHUQ-38]
MSRPVLRVATPLALTLVAGLGLAACTDKADPTGSSTAAGGPITVTATDTTCQLSATTAKAGTVTFQVTNAGSKVNEFYLYAEGDRIVSEVENITPGLKRELKVEITEPGTFSTACKPGMVGDGIRGTFTVTGTAVAGSADQKVAKAIADYKAFVASETDELVEGTEAFVAAVKAGDVAKAKSLYAQARHPWEAIEPVAESFGDLDPRIDGREDVVEEGMKFTGYHRLEKDLWVTGLKKDSNAIADQLLADVKEIAAKSKTVEPTALTIANGAKALLDEVATGKITGEEERYSHTDLWDFDGNLEGSRQALAVLRPVISAKAPELQKALDARFKELSGLLGSHKTGADYKSYTALSDADIKALTVALDALSEQVSKVPGVVEAK